MNSGRVMAVGQEDGRELVFVFDSLRRDGRDAHLMGDAEFLADGAVAGWLYEIEGMPRFFPTEGNWWVRGELFSVDRGGLEQLDRFVMGDAEAQRHESLKRVRVKFCPKVLLHEAREAWTWSWIGSRAGIAAIPSGDWVEHTRPFEKPLFTLVALMIFLMPFAVLIMLGDYSPAPHSLGDYLAGAAFLGLLVSPFLGWWATRIARRRRECLEGINNVIAGFFLIGCIMSMVAILAFVFESLWYLMGK